MGCGVEVLRRNWRMSAGLEVEREVVAGRFSGSRTSVITHLRWKPALDRRYSTLPIDRMNAGASLGYRRGGYIFIPMDEEGVGLTAADRTHCAPGLVIDDVPNGNVCFTLHTDAPNRGIRGSCMWR